MCGARKLSEIWSICKMSSLGWHPFQILTGAHSSIDDDLNKAQISVISLAFDYLTLQTLYLKSFSQYIGIFFTLYRAIKF